MNYPQKVRMKLVILMMSIFSFLPSTAQNFPINTISEKGFTSIFNGKSLENWKGDPEYWRVENGVIVGEVTAENILTENSFLIWKDSLNGDFELKVLFRVSERGNSGINYRSTKVPHIPFALKGYQADIDGPNMWTGQNYEERGRTFLALRGQMTSIENDSLPIIKGLLGNKKEMKSYIKTEDWNEYHLIISGNVLTHIINERLMSVVIDNDAQNQRFGGLIGVQVHVGPPMKIEFKDFKIKKLN